LGLKLILNLISWTVSSGSWQRSHWRPLEIALDDDVVLRGWCGPVCWRSEPSLVMHEDGLGEWCHWAKCEVNDWSGLVRGHSPFLLPQIRSRRMRTKPRAHTAIIIFRVILVIGYIFNHQKIICRVIGDGCLVFPVKLLLYLLLKCYWSMENIFEKVKRPYTHLLMSFNSNIIIIVGYIFNHQKIICRVTDDGCLIFPVKLLLYSLSMCFCFMKIFFQKSKDLKLIYLWAVIAL